MTGLSIFLRIFNFGELEERDKTGLMKSVRMRTVYAGGI